MTSRRTLTIAAFFYARSVSRGLSSDYVDWATAMLEHGHDSKNLRMLAGLESDNTFEAREHFLQAMRELGLSEPDPHTAMRAYACELAQQLASGTLDPTAGVRHLYDMCVTESYRRDFMIWYELDDALADIAAGNHPWTYPALTPENQSKVIREEAIKFMDAFSCKDVI